LPEDVERPLAPIRLDDPRARPIHPGMREHPSFALVAGDPVRALAPELVALSQRAFATFDAAYLEGRLPLVDGPCVALARAADDRLIGFKFGYRRGTDLFYSWLGAVDPAWRRGGVARRLMDLQHDWADREGYRSIETRTRASNRAMIILNLRSGFRIVGVETDRHGEIVVTQRRDLQGPD
jgi:GNAT superfamily N-acetyltransferase